jgi:hypothetical protein
MKILVYDNQQAYYELLRSGFSENAVFSLFNGLNFELADKEYNMIVFFIYDELELLDFIKLYQENIPIVLGLSLMNKYSNFIAQGNIHYLHLDKLKNEIIEDVGKLLKQYLRQ